MMAQQPLMQKRTGLAILIQVMMLLELEQLIIHHGLVTVQLLEPLQILQRHPIHGHGTQMTVFKMRLTQLARAIQLMF